jgi:hypothetical protein
LKKSYTIFERIQKLTLTFTLVVTGFVILILLWQLNVPFNIKFIVELIALILIFVFSLFIIVISEIPRTLPRSFDIIKNKIANQEIKNTEDFSKELNTFLVSFFNYISFDIDFAAIQVKDNPIIFSNDSLKSTEIELIKYTEQSKNQTDPIVLNKIKIDDKNYHPYIIPIHFGEEWLGYFAVFSKSKLNKIYIEFLDNFEDDFIDDQLIHVLRNSN